MTWIMVIFINPDFKRRVDELLLRQDETSTVQRKPNDNPRAGEGDDSQGLNESSPRDDDGVE